jgi:hypothetical protein
MMFTKTHALFRILHRSFAKVVPTTILFRVCVQTDEIVNLDFNTHWFHRCVFKSHKFSKVSETKQLSGLGSNPDHFLEFGPE